MDLKTIASELDRLSVGNAEYAEFNKRIVATDKQVLGVRTPDLRKLAKRIAKDWDFNDIKQFLNELNDDVYEQVILVGLLINQIKLSDTEKLELTKLYLAKVDSWAHIDIFVESKPNNQTDFWYKVAIGCLGSDREFTVRYGVVLLMKNFLRPDYIDKVLEAVSSIEYQGFYVKLAIAWLYAELAVDFYDRAMTSILEHQIDNWTSKKALQKMLESNRISSENKASIRQIKNNL